MLNSFAMKNFNYRLLRPWGTLALWALALSCSEAKFEEGVVQVTTTKPPPEVSILPAVDAKRPLVRRSDQISATFPASLVRNEAIHFELDAKEVSSSFTLEDIVRPIEEKRTQASRRLFNESFQQGHPPLATTENFDQRARKGAVDILIVIDNSVSMTEEQQNMSTKMNELLASLTQTDWQIGIVTTSPLIVGNEPQCSMTLVKSSDPDPTKAFADAILAGTSGNRTEYGILQAVVGLKCSSGPWLRPNATLAVLIVSDEDNCSDGNGCAGQAGDQESYLIDYVERDLGRVVGKNAGFYGIFSPPAQPCRTSVNAGNQYQRLVDYKNNGLSNYGNICDSSYKATLNRISDNIATLLTAEFTLNENPLPGTLNLMLIDSSGQEQEVPAGTFTVNGRSIQFFSGFEPPNGARLEARYLIAGTTVFQSLDLAQKPASSSLQIEVNGSLLAGDSYSVEGQRLTFKETPPPDSRLSISYRENVPLLDSFTLTQLPSDHSLEVKLGDKLLASGYSFDPNTRTLHFDTAPGDGEEVGFTYLYREGPQLSYALPLPEGSSNFQLFDGSKAIDFTEEDGVFTLAETVHEPGKVIRLRYNSPDWSPQLIALAHIPLGESLSVESGGEGCGPNLGLGVEGENIVLRCGVSTRTALVLNYQYRLPQREFTLAGIDDPEKGSWKVLANGKPIEKFSRIGSQVSLTYEPEDETRITLQYTWPQ